MFHSRDCLYESGLPIIRMARNTKRPIDPDGVNSPLPSEFENVGIRCGEAFQDGFLYVLDVDVKGQANGLKTLTEIEENLEPLPETLAVKSPSGGRHFYFKTEKPMATKRFHALGFELLGKGAKVVAPFSEIDGKKYEIISDNLTEIAAFPKSWLNYFLRHEKKQTEKKSISNAVPQGEQNNELFREACKMRRVGYGETDIFEMLKTRFKIAYEQHQDPKNPWTNADLLRIAKSAAKYDPAPDAKEHQPQSAAKVVTATTSTVENVITECLEESSGLVHDVALQILQSSKRAYDGFALASALQVVSGAAQGTYLGPSFFDTSRPEFDLTIYQWLTAQAATGKDHYHKSTTRLIQAIDPRLACPGFASNKALRAAMFGMNSAVSVTDELGDLFKKLSKGNAATFQQAILTDLKMLTNGLDVLNFDMTGSRKPPPIFKPKFSLFGTGTKESFLNLLGGEMVGSGLLSRFIVWPEPRLERKKDRRPFELVPATVDRLRAIFEKGLTEAGRTQDYEEILHQFFAYTEGKRQIPPEALPQTAAKRVLGIDQDAMAHLRAFEFAQETIFIEMRKSNDEHQPGSIADRAGFLAKKVAAIHCVGRQSETINLDDATFATKLVKALSDDLCETVSGNSGETHFEKTQSRVISFLKKQTGPISYRDVSRHFGRRCTSQLLNSVLLDCVQKGLLSVTDRGGAVVEVGQTLPRGGRFQAV